MDIVITRPTSELLGSQHHDAIKKKKKRAWDGRGPLEAEGLQEV